SLIMLPAHPRQSPLFPSTTLFRSEVVAAVGDAGRVVPQPVEHHQPVSRSGSADHLALKVVVETRVHQLQGYPRTVRSGGPDANRSEEHTSELQSRENLVCRLLHEK